MKKTFAIILTLLLGAAAFAQETPRWIRKNQISPDGTQIAFSYKGDIFVVPVAGGKARQITTNNAYDSGPMWTADGKGIVFYSYREKSQDIYLTSVEGGTPKRLTTHPGNENPLCVTSNGKVIFASKSLGVDVNYDGFPGYSQLYYTDFEGSRPVRITPLPIDDVSVSKDGKILYEDWKGYEDNLRKHHESAVTKDIWLYEGDGSLGMSAEGSFTKLSDYKGEDRNPVFAADGDTFYYLSERDGAAMNVYKSSISNPSKSVQLTSYTKNPVRYLSVAENGTLAFSYNGDLYTMKEGSEPKLVEITVYSDQDERAVVPMQLRNGFSDISVSPNGKEIALVLRGDVFVTSVDYNTTKRITNTAVQERNVCFSEDGRSLYYSSERNGNWGIYRSTLVNKDDKYFVYSNDFEEELFSDKGETCFQPDVSPDGKYVAYLRDRTELVIKPAKGGETISLLKGANYSYSDGDISFEWGPDSRHILSDYAANGGWHNADICMIDIDTKEITNITQSGYNDGGYRWALDGKAMTWESDKNGYRSHGSWGTEGDVYIMFFDGKAMSDFSADKEGKDIAKMLSGEDEGKDRKRDEKKDSTKTKKVEKLEPDLVNSIDRVQRLTRFSGNMRDHWLTPDGSKLYYITQLESGFDLCLMDIAEKSVKVIKKEVMGSLVPSRDGKFLYIASRGGIDRIAVEGGPDKRISFQGEFEYKAPEERQYMFDHIWKQVKEKFYDPDLHGVDWDYYKENYSQFVPYINNGFDFQELLSELLGELNGSHTGGRYYYRENPEMGYLGVIYDDSYTGDGLKIAEVLINGALNLADSEIAAGDIITAIEGTPIKAGQDWYRLLTDKAGKRVSVTVKKGKKECEIFVQPQRSESELLYTRWVKQREAKVQEISGGRIGYVHVKGMNSPSFREVFSKALGKYRTTDALVVDTRHNGGGWLHDDLVTFLSGKRYVNYTPRGQYIGHDPFAKWTKPSCVLMSEDNYSDACGFPYAYRALGIGKLIGTPVAGTMTAVWWEYQIDGDILFGIPEVGSWCIAEGHYSENHQLEPDIAVDNDPASILRGEDAQLTAAVLEMLKAAE